MTRPLPSDPLDPEAPGLDDATRRRRQRLAEMEKMSPEELRALAVRAGILTPGGELTAPYQDDTPSPYRDARSGNALDFPILRVLRSSSIHGALTVDEIAGELGKQWAVSGNEVLGRLRRMVGLELVDEVQSLRFLLTDAGRTAEPAR